MTVQRYNNSNRIASMSDRYQLSREFEIQKFEMEIMQTTDLYAVQELCVRLFAQTISQRAVYESLLRETLPKMP